MDGGHDIVQGIRLLRNMWFTCMFSGEVYGFSYGSFDAAHDGRLWGEGGGLNMGISPAYRQHAQCPSIVYYFSILTRSFKKKASPCRVRGLWDDVEKLEGLLAAQVGNIVAVGRAG